MRWLVRRVAVFSLLALVGGCDEKSVPKNEKPKPVLSSTLTKANHCVADADCVDVGAVCPVECHVLVNHADPALLDVSMEVAVARQEVFDGRCSMECNQPFNGLECRGGKCVQRANPPAEPICLGEDGGRTDCMRILRENGYLGRCRELCDGRGIDGKRLTLRLQHPLADGGHYSTLVAVDYMPCSACP